MLGTSGQARLTAVVLLLFAAGAVQCTPIRGVDPAAASLYQPAGGMFSCIDGAKAIPFAQVNDQYCDCFDGSDEPGAVLGLKRGCFHAGTPPSPASHFATNFACAGTAACANGKFYCANVGFQPTMLNSSFVDDGVCGKSSMRPRPAPHAAAPAHRRGPPLNTAPFLAQTAVTARTSLLARAPTRARSRARPRWPACGRRWRRRKPGCTSVRNTSSAWACTAMGTSRPVLHPMAPLLPRCSCWAAR